MSATVAWIAIAPIKGLRLQQLEAAEVTPWGVRGDRAFVLVDADGRMVSATRIGALLAIVPHHDAHAGTLALAFPGGEQVSAPIELGAPATVAFYGNEHPAHELAGPFSAAISAHCGVALRLLALPPERTGVDRGRDGAVTLLSSAALERLRAVGELAEPIDPRRFRMTFGIAGVAAHEEEAWQGREIALGDVRVRVMGQVGRCAVTTRDADSGVVDCKMLHLVRRARAGVEASEPLPLGAHARVLAPGMVRLGDTVRACTR